MNQQQFKTVCEELRAKGGYLADPQLLGRLEWFEETRLCHRVVTREAAEQYRQALDAKGQLAPPPSAVLSAIVRLNTLGFYMTACAGWYPYGLPVNAPQRLADVKPSAWTTDPGIPALSGDFRAGWDNLAKLIKGYFPKNSRKFRQSGGVINWSGGKGDSSYGFQILHRLFEPKPEEEEAREEEGRKEEDEEEGDKDEDEKEEDEEEKDKGDEEEDEEDEEQDEEEEDDEEEVDPRFLIENWPVQNPATQVHLDAIKSTHVVNPIPAYDVEGRLILPTKYEHKLRGAIVRLEFRLTHWVVRRHDFFSADVVRIRVLVPPYSDTSTAPRKRLAPVDDFYDDYPATPPTPMKRPRLNMEEERQFRLSEDTRLISRHEALTRIATREVLARNW